MIYSEIEDFADLFLRGVKLAKAGDVHHGHRHYYDHVTLLTHGAVRIDWRDEDGTTGHEEYDASERDQTIQIKATRWHQITATKDDTRWWCVFAVRECDPKTPSLYMGERPED